jgi:hypothetical protein
VADPSPNGTGGRVPFSLRALGRLRERHAGGQPAASHTGYSSVATSESVPTAITLSLRRLWTIYKGISISGCRWFSPPLD